MRTCESALMAKVCEMIVNRDYIRENNVGHPPRASYRMYVSAECVGVYASYISVYVCMRARCFHARVWKKSGPTRGRAGAGGRRYFFTRNERVQGETCIRLAESSRVGGGRAGGEDER